MYNKKTMWLGLIAILTALPILVASQPESPQPPATPEGAPAKLTTGPAPFTPPLSFNPFSRIRLTAFQPAGEEKKGETPPTQPQVASTLPIARLPSVAGDAPADAPPSPGPEKNVAPPATASTSVGGVLADSNAAQGVEIQRRSPLVGDPRIQGLHFGQIVTQADGGYWFPVRIDLDTVVSKLNSSDVKNILIVQGPYSVRYGAGFAFLDIETIPTPRSTIGCFDAHGSTSINMRTNYQGWAGQQSFWGGNTDWGFRISYDVLTAGDYFAGNGDKLPGRYNNQFVNFAYGVDLTKDCNVEVRYLHVLQTGVLLPGLLTGVNSLTTDAFTGRLSAVNGVCYDKLTLDVWVNNTGFNGNSANPATRTQIPELNEIFVVEIPRRPGTQPGGGSGGGGSTFFPVRLDINAEGNALSWGYREITTWGDLKGFNLSIGTDLRFFRSNYNEFDAFNLSVLQGTGLPANLGIPGASQVDPGILIDSTIPWGENWLFKVGGRVDFVTNDFIDFGPNVDVATYNQIVGDPRDRAYFMYAGFITGEYKVTDQWTAQGGYGYAQRSPTLTELYSGGAFFGQIQNGFNSIYGNPELRREEMHHLNVGFNGKYDDVRMGVNSYYAFLPNYITYRTLGLFTVDLGPLGQGVTPIQQLQFINTRSATLWGVDLYGEVDATPWLTPFATFSYVQGWDQFNDEALPGIAPMYSRVGLRFHEPGNNPRWGVEYFARMVGTQDLFADSLGEQRTGGFVVHNLRGYWQPTEKLLFLAGVENIGDRYYREHLDLRTGLAVFQPGINFYLGAKITY